MSRNFSLADYWGHDISRSNHRSISKCSSCSSEVVNFLTATTDNAAALASSPREIIRITSNSRRHLMLTLRTDPIFKSFQIPKFSEIYFFQVGKFMYSYKIGLLPNVFKEMF